MKRRKCSLNGSDIPNGACIQSKEEHNTEYQKNSGQGRRNYFSELGESPNHHHGQQYQSQENIKGTSTQPFTVDSLELAHLRHEDDHSQPVHKSKNHGMRHQTH